MGLAFGLSSEVDVFRWAILVVVLMCFSLVDARPKSSDPVKVSADVVEIDPEGRSAQLSGTVRIIWGDLSLTSDQIQVRYNEDGAPEQWIAEGNVRLHWRAYKMHSKRLNIQQKADALVFLGPLDLVRGDTRLTASQATLYFKTQRFVVQKVSGELRLKMPTESK